MLHVTYLDNVDQFILLQVTFPGASSSACTLIPLHQLIQGPQQGNTCYAFPNQNPDVFPTIAMEPPLGKGKAG